MEGVWAEAGEGRVVKDRRSSGSVDELSFIHSLYILHTHTSTFIRAEGPRKSTIIWHAAVTNRSENPVHIKLHGYASCVKSSSGINLPHRSSEDRTLLLLQPLTVVVAVASKAKEARPLRFHLRSPVVISIS